MAGTNRPEFRDLSQAEAVELLGRQRVGRVAFTFHDRVDIEPISYVFADGWIYGRTSPGTKLTTVLHHPWVAFEVDEVHTRFDWRSVVVHGTIYFVEPGTGTREHDAYTRAVETLHTVEADALTAADATPHRTALFRIHVDQMVGRMATTR